MCPEILMFYSWDVHTSILQYLIFICSLLFNTHCVPNWRVPRMIRSCHLWYTLFLWKNVFRAVCSESGLHICTSKNNRQVCAQKLNIWRPRLNTTKVFNNCMHPLQTWVRWMEFRKHYVWKKHARMPLCPLPWSTIHMKFLLSTLWVRILQSVYIRRPL